MHVLVRELVKRDVATYPLGLPRSLKAGIERVSKRDGTSVNQFVAMVAA